MCTDEAALWERLAQARRVPLDPTWLGEIYSPSLSLDLRKAIAEKLGMLAEKGWPVIKHLVEQHGSLPELVLASGLCHQPDARDWLLTQAERNNDNSYEPIGVAALEALACWGAEVPESLVRKSLQHPAQQVRLAGLQLLLFRAHLLDDQTLLLLCEEALKDFRDPVVISAIRLLQRRDGTVISRRLAELCREGSDAVARSALLALGCIATSDSQRCLLELSRTLPEGDLQKQACKQLKQQFRH